jgi:hypothetical protein
MGDSRTPIDPQGRHGLEHLLGINGIKSNPDQVNLDTIHPTVDMSMGGHAKVYDPANERYHCLSLALSGSSNVEGGLITYGNLIGGLEMVYDIGHTLRIIALDYRIHVDEDAAGFVLPGKSYSIAFLFVNGTASVAFYRATHSTNAQAVSADSQYYQQPGDWMYEPAFLNAGGVTSRYSHAFGSGNQIRCPLVPPTWGVNVQAFTNCLPAPNANHFDFPPGSFMQISVLAQQVPWGAPIPSYW